MVLDLPARNYTDYLATLSPFVRKEIRRNRRKSLEHRVQFAHGPIEPRDIALQPLLDEVCLRHGARLFHDGLFAALSRDMARETVVFRAFADDRPVGFFLGIRQGNLLLAVLTGLRYELAYPAGLYFTLLDELVRWSLAHGIQRIHAGLSNESQKQRHGFRPQPRWLCVRPPFRGVPRLSERILQ
jgi:predicted N-acyltransferase